MNPLDMLYEWCQQEFRRTEAQIQESGIRAMLKYVETDSGPFEISKEEFGSRMRSPWRTHTTKQAWINRIIAGHESETRALPEDLRLFLEDCSRDVPPCLNVPVAIKPPHFSSTQARIARPESA